MSQHDQVLANNPGATFRADANSALAAIFSNSSGATEPSTMVAYQFWGDTTTGILKQRNSTNTAWVSLWTMSTGVMIANAALAGSASQDFAVKKLTVSETEGIVGTTTNNDAQAGSIGEVIESTVTATNAPATGTYGDLTSIPLTAGDWDVEIMLQSLINGATCTSVYGGLGTASGTSTTGLVGGDTSMEGPPPTAAYNPVMTMATKRVSLAAPATYYLKYGAIYSAGTPQLRGRITARRAR